MEYKKQWSIFRSLMYKSKMHIRRSDVVRRSTAFKSSLWMIIHKLRVSGEPIIYWWRSHYAATVGSDWTCFSLIYNCWNVRQFPCENAAVLVLITINRVRVVLLFDISSILGTFFFVYINKNTSAFLSGIC